MIPRSPALLLAALVALSLPSARAANDLGETQKVLVPGGSPGDDAATSVSISGDWAAVGAPDDSHTGLDEAGSVSLFRREGGQWVFKDRIVEPGASAHSGFGHAVALDGDRLLVTAFEHFWGGSAYIFERSGNQWDFSATLARDEGPGFGVSADLSAEFAVVGQMDIGATGFAHIYREGGGSWSIDVVYAGGPSADEFGAAVAVEAEVPFPVVLVGTPGRDSGRGVVHHIRHDPSAGWIYTGAMNASDGQAGDRFGEAVAVRGKRAVVGAPHKNSGAPNSGAAYAFRDKPRSGGWIQEKLRPPTIETGAAFGQAVAATEEALLVSATGEADVGRAHLFRETGNRYIHQLRLITDHPDARQIGRCCALDGGRVLLGDQNDVEQGTNSGAAYAYDPPEFYLAIEPGSAALGDPIALTAGAGPASRPAVLTLSSLDGQHQFQIFNTVVLDADGSWTLSTVVPALSGLSGHTLGLQMMSLVPGVGISVSNEALLAIE